MTIQLPMKEMLQSRLKYMKKSSTDYSHMMKLTKMTHEIRRTKINNSTLSVAAIKEESGIKNGYVKVYVFIILFIF